KFRAIQRASRRPGRYRRPLFASQGSCDDEGATRKKLLKDEEIALNNGFERNTLPLPWEAGQDERSRPLARFESRPGASPSTRDVEEEACQAPCLAHGGYFAAQPGIEAQTSARGQNNK